MLCPFFSWISQKNGQDFQTKNGVGHFLRPPKSPIFSHVSIQKYSIPNGNLQGIITAIGYGQDIVDGQSYNILGISAQTQGRWTYYNKNSGSEGLPPDEIWGFGLQLGFDNIYIVIFISGTSGKIFHATYNASWGPWWEH